MRKLVRSTVLNSVSDRPSAKEAWRRAAAIMFVPAGVRGVPAASRWLNTARQELVSSRFACQPDEVCQESMSVALFVLLCASLQIVLVQVPLCVLRLFSASLQ